MVIESFYLLLAIPIDKAKLKEIKKDKVVIVTSS